VVDEARKKLALLLVRAELDHRLQAESGRQQRGWNIDIDSGQLFGGKREIHRRQSRAAVRLRDQRFHEPGLRHRAVKGPGGVESAIRPIDLRDRFFHTAQHGARKATGIRLKPALFLAQSEIDSHSRLRRCLFRS
jgi:hypothetical protein